MRISSNLFFQTGLKSINAQQSDLMHLYQQIGSGQRSADSIGSRFILAARQQLHCRDLLIRVAGISHL